MKRRTTNNYDELNRDLLKLLSAQDPKALDAIAKIKKIGVDKKDNQIIGYAYYRYAYFYYFSVPDVTLFRKNVQKAIQYLLRSEDKEYLGGAYNLVAYDAIDQACYDIAYAYYMIAVKTAEQVEGIALPGLIEANAGRLLVELGDYKKGQKQLQHAVRTIAKFKDMYVYNYNMILTYAEIALASFLLNELDSVEKALKNMQRYLLKANEEEIHLSKTYHLLTTIYHALLRKDDNQIDHSIDALIEHWNSLSTNETIGSIFELESLCSYMLEHDYITQVAKLLKASTVLKEDDNLTITLRYYNLQISYYEKIHDLTHLKECLRKQHEIQKKYNAELAHMRKYSMEFSDMSVNLTKEREKANIDHDTLQQQANTDSLTGLPNRNAMNRYLEEKFVEAKNNQSSFGIGIIDIDDFKNYNDQYGHQLGDQCLERVGKALLSFSENPNLFCARFGGDEFVVGYFDLSDKEIQDLANQMQEKVSKETAHINRKVKKSIHISQGIHNAIPDATTKLWDYLYIADEKLYMKKQSLPHKKNE